MATEERGENGATPLLSLNRLSAAAGVSLAAKIEWASPGGSAKDRVAAALWAEAAAGARGALIEGCAAVTASAGNGAVALARLARSRGARLLVAMPGANAEGYAALLAALGAEVSLTPGSRLLPAVERARAISAALPRAVVIGAHDSPAAALAHEATTAEEIWRQSGGRVDVFVAGIGTGATISGVGRLFRKRALLAHVVGVEAEGCAVLSGGAAGEHEIPGLGAGFIPRALDRSVIDELVTVSAGAAAAAARLLAREEGLLAGISSGAVVAAALHLAQRPALQGKRFVLVFPDSAERYLATPFFRTLVD